MKAPDPRREIQTAAAIVAGAVADGCVGVHGKLPHGYPFLMLDRVLGGSTGSWIAATKTVSLNCPFLGPGGVWPGVLLVEVMAQAAGLLLAGEATAKTRGSLAAVNRFRCSGTVVGGDHLLVIARLVRQFGALAKVRAVVWAGKRRRGAAEIVVHVELGRGP
jgi:3-hydroxyacyl-[acyl-carrier-protein] dehydratase